uniref:Raptor N-terminal CASPase-like domain-containing protein n=1 Tax=Ditylenchus dipsaci TaxID=166011 RepID=A0A915CZ32_9BILA
MDGAEKTWFREARHVEEIQASSLEVENKDEWRKIRDRMKTVSVALVLCLNVGVDPPDVEKPNPCARKLPGWIPIHPPRARYKSAIDPTVECVKKLCTSLRKNAKEERVLFHFNGHGVPKPTEAGEIWVFNKYIPLSLYDLQSWMGMPSVYLWDCSSAGTVVNMFMRFADDHSMRRIDDYQPVYNGNQGYPSSIPEEFVDRDPTYPQPYTSGNKEGSPLSFGSALQLDIFIMPYAQDGTKSKFPPNIIDELPGNLSDRRTLLGELNWIFTAITDTIAWSSLPMETFQKLFRQDLLIASLFRSFLLAERIMFENGCHVVSQPQLPSVHSHPCWEYWNSKFEANDLVTLDLCLSNFHNLMNDKGGSIMALGRNEWFMKSSLKHNVLIELPVLGLADTEYAYSRFFIEQLQAFEVWLKFGNDKCKPPQQLPVLLQVLLSQVHRVKALELLAKFVDLGSWAVVAALSVGIFPYVLKLLQCNTKELRASLAFIWAKILSIDPVCQYKVIVDELIKDNGYFYFIQILNDPSLGSRLKIVPAFVMATLICNNYRKAQEKLIGTDYIHLCTELLSNSRVTKCRMLCLWLLIGLGRLWADYDRARWLAIRSVAYERVEDFLNDDVPEVRAAAVYALGCFVHNRSRNSEHATTIDNEVCDKLCEKCTYDGSVLVRAELAAAIQWFIIDFESRFSELCLELDKKLKNVNGLGPTSNQEKSVKEMQEPGEMTETAGLRSLSSFSSLLGYSRPVRDREAPTTPRIKAADSKYSTSNADAFKKRIFAQMRALEAKTFKDPFERIWLSLLHLCFDPFELVSKMGMKLVSHIWELSRKTQTSRARVTGDSRSFGNHNTSIINNHNGSSEEASNSVKFMVGSPGISATNAHNFRKLSAIENVEQLRQCASIADMLSSGLIETSSTNFTPKRNLFGSQSGRYNEGEDDFEDNLAVEGIVSTQFVDWCSKTFTQPIYKTIYEETSTSASPICTNSRNSLVDSSTPFTKAHKDVELVKSEKAKCENQQMHLRNERTITSTVWSYLRPYVYVCDGEVVALYNSSREHQQNVCQFVAYKEDLLEDTITDLMLNGLIKVWDPMFCEHSHDIQTSPKLVTAAYLLNDVPDHIWLQESNVRVCRLWDAWCEKSVLDLSLRSKNSTVSMTTSIACDLNYNLVSCGFADGTFAFTMCACHRLKDQRLVVGSQDGDVRVWEPRMYQEAIVDFNVGNAEGGVVMQMMDVQKPGQLIACALEDSTVRLFDVSGKKCLSKIRYSTRQTSPRGYTNDSSASCLTAMRFHESKVLIGIALNDNSFSAYGVPSLLNNIRLVIHMCYTNVILRAFLNYLIQFVNTIIV